MAPEEELQAGSAPGPQQGQHTTGDKSGSLAGTIDNAEAAKEAVNPQRVDGSLFYDAQEGTKGALLVIIVLEDSCRSPLYLFLKNLQVMNIMLGGADWDWSEDEASWAGCPDTEEAVRADHVAAMDWYRRAKMRGEEIHAVSLETPSSPSSECLAQKSVQ